MTETSSCACVCKGSCPACLLYFLEHDYLEIAACLLSHSWQEYSVQEQPRTAPGQENASAEAAEQLVTDSMFWLILLVGGRGGMSTVTRVHVYCLIDGMFTSLYDSMFTSSQGPQRPPTGAAGTTGSGMMIMDG